MTYKIRKQRDRRPLPMPEALPGRGDKPWTIKNALPGHARCRFVEEEGGTLAVPLDDKPCEKCGKNHASSIRLHEMAHAAISPNANKVRTSFQSDGEKYEVSNLGLQIAEEMRADYLAHRTAMRNYEHREFETDCLVEDGEFFQELLENGDFREFAIQTLSRSGGISMANKARNELGRTIDEALDNDDDKTAERLGLYHRVATNIIEMAQDLKTFARKSYATNLRSWTRQLHVSYSVDQMLEAVEDHMAEFQMDLDALKNAMEESKKNDIEKIEKDLRHSKDDNSPQRTLLRALPGGSGSFKKALKAAESVAEGEPADNVKWGEMFIEEPRLTKKLPIHKKGWRAKASDEGVIPIYMHRWPVDQAIFKARRRVQTGAVLIDASGSMALTKENLEAIMAAAPAGIVALYSGIGHAGTLRVIGRNGKYLNFEEHAETYHAETDNPFAYQGRFGTGFEWRVGLAGGNDIDKPALEWLAEQPLPRIWVSDGYVVSPSHGLSYASWADCKPLIEEARINRVETPEEAALALEGKLALWR